MTDKFEIIYKGTSLLDCLEVRKYKHKNTIVLDNKNGYGNTISKHGCIIEEIPQLIRGTDPLIDKIKEMNIHAYLNFLIIKNHYFFKDRVAYKIPTNKNEVSDSDFLSNKEKFYLFQAMKNKNPIGILEKLSPTSCDILVKGICGSSDMCIDRLMRFMMNFEDYMFLYPVFGFKDVCENISRCNAVNGISYLLDENSNIEMKDSLYEVDTKYGKIYGEKMVEMSYDLGVKKYYRVINYSEMFYFESFYGVFDGSRHIFCICLNHVAKVCPENTYLLYFWKEGEEITDVELENLGIDSEKRVYEHSFVTELEFDYDLVIKE